jgi:basic amino acid/polyamine antiporter, APA family
VLPVLSALACLWLMLNLPAETWARFAIWMVIGLVVYFVYSHRHSRLAPGNAPRERTEAATPADSGRHPAG